MRRSLVAICALAVAGCAPRAPAVARGPGPCVVDVQSTWTSLDLDRALHACTSEPIAAIVLGRLPPTAADARPVTLRFAGQHVDGFVLPAEDWQRALQAPPIHNLLVLFFRDGKLRGGHPSDMSSTGELEPPAPGAPVDEQRDTVFALVDWKGNERAEEALPMLLAAAGPSFRFVTWAMSEPPDLKTRLPDGASFRIGTPDESPLLDTIAFTPDDTLLATGGTPGGITFLDTRTQKVVRTIATKESVSRLAFAPDGRSLAASASGDVHVWAWPSGAPLATLKHARHVESMSFVGPSRIVTVDNMHDAHLWDVATGKRVEDWSLEQEIDDVAGSPEGAFVALGVPSIGIRIVRPGATTARKLPENWGQPRLAFAPTGKPLAVACYDAIHLVDPDTGADVRVIDDGTMGQAVAIAYSSDGKRLATVSNEREISAAYGVRVWDVATGRLLGKRKLASGIPRAIALSHDGKWLAVAAADGTIVFWPALVYEPSRAASR